MAVPAGSHLVEIREAGTGADTTPALTATIDLAAGNRYDVVAHVDQAGAPMVSLFLDDVSPLPPGQARAVVRNTAATGPIDVRFGPTVAAAALANGAGSTDPPARRRLRARRLRRRDAHADHPDPQRHAIRRAPRRSCT